MRFRVLTFIVICHVLTFAVYTFEYVGAWSTLHCFKSWWIELRVGLAVLCHIPMMLEFVGSIIFLASGSMSSTGKSWMSLFTAVVTLKNIWVYVCGPDSSNESTKIEGIINQEFSFKTALRVPYVKPNNSHIRFGRCFDGLATRWIDSKSSK